MFTRKIFIGIFLPMLLLINLIPYSNIAYADSIDDNNMTIDNRTLKDETYYLVSEIDTIPLYEEANIEKEVYLIPNFSKIQLLEEDVEVNGLQFIQYVDEQEDKILEGYVESEYILNKEEYTKLSDAHSEQDETPDMDSDELENPIPENTEQEIIEEEIDDDETNDSPVENSEDENLNAVDKDNSEIITEENLDDEVLEVQENNNEENLDNDFSNNLEQEDNNDVILGNELIENDELEIDDAIDEKENDDDSNILEKDAITPSMNLSTFNISNNSLRGVAKKTITNVRETTSTTSKIIKQFPIGSVIKYAPYSEHWYVIQVDINGKTVNGFIHKKHVTTVKTVPKDFKGVAKKTTTNVRAGASTKSKIIKQFPIGTVIHYKSFSKNWNEIVVNVNGQTITGFIHKKHVTNINTIPVEQKAIAIKSPTNVRVGVSTKSKVLTKLKLNEVIDVRTFSKNWVEITVKIDNTFEKGYIHKKHIGSIEDRVLTGVAAKEKTNLRTSPSTSAKILTSVPKGTVIQYQVYNDNWYKTSRKVNGVNQVGYIHKKHMDKQRIIYVDAGHGGSDTGASANGLQEKNLTLDIALRVQSLLLGKGYHVIMSRVTDTFVSLADRTTEANNKNADIFVSIHINAGGGTGIETFKMNAGPNSKNSNILAQELQNSLIKETKANNRGVKDADFHVNRESKMPSSLVEVGFIDHRTDSDKLKQNSFKQSAAIGIVNGITSYFDAVS